MARYDFVVIGSGPAGRRARIEAEVPLALYQRVGIEAKAFAAPVFGKVQWTSKQEYGISFERGFGLGELARIAWSLHDPAAGASGLRLEVVDNKNLRTMNS
jgi:hypothetical protein